MMFALTVATLPLLAQSTGTFMRKNCHKTIPTPNPESAGEIDDDGNKIGTEYDFGGSAFDAQGEKILIINILGTQLVEGNFPYRDSFNEAINALKNTKNFSVISAIPAEPEDGEPGLALNLMDSNNELPLKTLSLRDFLFFDNEGPSHSQLWIIDGPEEVFSSDDVTAIEEYYNKGGSLFLWADNEPYNQNVNKLAKIITGYTVSGDYEGNRDAGAYDGQKGFENDVTTTGLTSLYVGHTVAAIKRPKDDDDNKFSPIIYSLENTTCRDSNYEQLAQEHCPRLTPETKEIITVAARYEETTDEGLNKRLIIDGGFTRIDNEYFNKAGTHRYVMNCAVWLYGYGRASDDDSK